MKKLLEETSIKKLNINLLLGGVFGFLSIAFGAYAAHVLKTNISADDYENVMKAVGYQQLHAAMMGMLGLTQFFILPPIVLRRFRLAGFLYAAGIVLFCGGIYVGTLTEIHAALRLAPAGGFAFMLGWLVLASAGLAGRPESGPGA